MKKMKFGKSKNSGKGFYIALALSLVAVGTATTIAIGNTIGQLDNSANLPSSSASSWNYSDVAEKVDTSKSDVPKEESSSTAPVSSAASSEPSSQTKPQETAFAYPLTGEVIHEYSKGELVKSVTMNDWRTHDGIDLKADANTPVKSCADGTVAEVTTDSLWGVCITIEHANGVTSYYYGLTESVQVKQGQEVAIGDVIGYVGDTNQLEVAEEPHLHFAMKQDGAWVDPISLLS